MTTEYMSALRLVLLGDAGIAALVGNRVYWGTLPQPATFPAITLNPVADSDVISMEGRSGLGKARVQIDGWGVSFTDATAIGARLKALLSAFPRTLVDGYNLGPIFYIGGPNRRDTAQNKFQACRDFYVYNVD